MSFLTQSGFFKAASAGAATAYIIEYTTTSTNQTITTPAKEYTNATITYSDGFSETKTDGTAFVHTFVDIGVHTASIEWDVGRIEFANGGDRAYMSDLIQWGTCAWTSMSKAYYGCQNSNYSATDIPNVSNVTSFVRAFQAFGWSGVGEFDFTEWDTANVTDWRYCFQQCKFTANIDNLDMSGAYVSLASFLYTSTNMTLTTLGGTISSSVTNLASAFRAGIANPSFAGCDFSGVTAATNCLLGSSFDQTNYEELLAILAGQSLNSGVLFHAGTATYGSGTPATNKATVEAMGWTFTDGGQV